MTTVAYRLELDVLPDMIPEDYHGDLPMFTEAIEAVRAGDEDKLIRWVDDDGEPWARAYQIVAIFDLTAFTLEKP